MPRDPVKQVYVELVSSLLDARSDPATERFDAELDSAVHQGEVSPELARRLRFWQRATVHALADHARSVVPTVLGVLDASSNDAKVQVSHLITSLHGVTDRTVDPTRPPGAESSTATPTDDGDGLDDVVDLRDTPEPASAQEPPEPRRVVGKHRLLVAGLVPAPGLSSDHS